MECEAEATNTLSRTIYKKLISMMNPIDFFSRSK